MAWGAVGDGRLTTPAALGAGMQHPHDLYMSPYSVHTSAAAQDAAAVIKFWDASYSGDGHVAEQQELHAHIPRGLQVCFSCNSLGIVGMARAEID